MNNFIEESPDDDLPLSAAKATSSQRPNLLNSKFRKLLFPNNQDKTLYFTLFIDFDFFGVSPEQLPRNLKLFFSNQKKLCLGNEKKLFF